MPKARKPIIGVVPLVDKQRESYWMLPGYFEGIIEAGGLPVMLSLTNDAFTLDQALSVCDGLLITGGQDVSPAVYGEKDPEAVALVGRPAPRATPWSLCCCCARSSATCRCWASAAASR